MFFFLRVPPLLSSPLFGPGTTMFDPVDKERKIWKFDKRGWNMENSQRKYARKIAALPPFQEGLTYQVGGAEE